jgi:hypothetical protein
MSTVKHLTTSKRAIYREQGGRLYKIKGHQCVEVTIEGEYGTNFIGFADHSPVWPNSRSNVIRKAKFDKAAKAVLQKIKLFLR